MHGNGLVGSSNRVDVIRVYSNLVLEKSTNPRIFSANFVFTLKHTRVALAVYRFFKPTYCVYVVVLPEFLELCPTLMSFSGVLMMGSSFLTVNER